MRCSLTTVVLCLALMPSPLQALVGGGAKEEWTVGHLPPSSPVWLGRLALPTAQWPCASRRACPSRSCPSCSLQAPCAWISSPWLQRSCRRPAATGLWGPLLSSRGCRGHRLLEAQTPSSPPGGGCGLAGLAAGHTVLVPSPQPWRDPGVPSTHSHSAGPATDRRRSRPVSHSGGGCGGGGRIGEGGVALLGPVSPQIPQTGRTSDLRS